MSKSRFGYDIVMRESTHLASKVKSFRDWTIEEAGTELTD